VLDNFEQVLNAAPLIADLLSSIASLRVLATSRAALRVRGEREYVIGPLLLDLDSEATSPADLARFASWRQSASAWMDRRSRSNSPRPG
jgi:predicted ATPase